MTNTTEIVLAVIGLLSAIVTGVLVPLIRSKTSAEKQSEIAKWVNIAVSAAEQIFTETKAGKEKKEWVLNFLREQGVNVDDGRIYEQINAMIEAFVAEMNHPNVTVMA